MKSHHDIEVGLRYEIRGSVGRFYCELYEDGKMLPARKLGPFRTENVAREAGDREIRQHIEDQVKGSK
jgi:hypothetical protein